jgi:hypothetical protein
MKTSILLGVIVALSSVCPLYATEYRKATEIERLQAHCDQAGSQAERSYFAFGAPLFVAGAGIGAAIRRSIDHQRAFDNCMAEHGYIKVDGGGETPAQTRATR